MRQLITRFLAFALVAAISLTGCSNAGVSGQMTGEYKADTLTVIDNLRTAINVSPDDPDRDGVEVDARNIINDYFSFYRRDNAVDSLSSFATLRTALNGLAGHYSSYPNRPVPEKLKQRLEQEFKQVEAALKRGA
ncbi:MAG: photosystem II protein Psb27 [Cyanobacteria bacterium P01_C01_bin.120]